MNAWLSFVDPVLEATYQRYVEGNRAQGNLDRALVLFQALEVGGGIPLLIRAGQLLSQLPTVCLVAAFAMALVWLHLRSPRDSLSAAATLRVPLHLVIHAAHILHFIRVAVLPEMALCIEGKPAVELMATYLAILGATPVLTAVPFRLAFPLQLALAGALLHSGPSLCELGIETCPAAEDKYLVLADALSHMALVLPEAAPPAVFEPYDACRAVMLFMVAVFFVGVHLAAAVVVEQRARAAFAAARSDRVLANRLAKSPTLMRMTGMAVVYIVFVWRLAELLYAKD